MATQLLVNVLSIGPIAPLGSTVVPHGLKVAGVGVVPTQVICDRASSLGVMTADATNVYFANLSSTDVASARFRVEFDHSIHAVDAAANYWKGYVPPASGSGPTQPAAWGNEYLWWKLSDAPQSGASPNVAANSGSAGSASLTATTNATGGNSNGGAFYDKTPMFGVSGIYSSISRFRGSTNTLQGADAQYSGTTAFTLSAWANISESGGAFVCDVAAKKHTSGYSVLITTSGGRAYFSVRTAGGEVQYYTAQYIFPYGLPTFLAMTYDGTTIRGYVNGQEVVSGAQTGAIVWTTGAGSEWEIGQPSGGIERYDVWDVRTAPSVRSAAQLLADYKTGLGLTY
jgi:hypothetical protein